MVTLYALLAKKMSKNQLIIRYRVTQSKRILWLSYSSFMAPIIYTHYLNERLFIN
jgi:hypothetical protein